MKIFNANRDGGGSNAFFERNDSSKNSDGSKDSKKQKSNPYANTALKLEPATIVVTDEAVNAAIDSFKSDGQSINQGIEVEKQGTGPGLKVVLRDSAGAIIKNLSAEEFLKLREAASDGRVSGKILDQKA